MRITPNRYHMICKCQDNRVLPRLVECGVAKSTLGIVWPLPQLSTLTVTQRMRAKRTYLIERKISIIDTYRYCFNFKINEIEFLYFIRVPTLY